MHGWGVWKHRQDHVTSQLYSSKATSKKAARAHSHWLQWERIAWWQQHRSIYLGCHSQLSNTALWGTQQTWLAFPLCHTYWLCVTMPKNTIILYYKYHGFNRDGTTKTNKFKPQSFRYFIYNLYLTRLKSHWDWDLFYRDDLAKRSAATWWKHNYKNKL